MSTATSQSVVDALEQCRTITESTTRLACFDRAATALAEARAHKDVVVVDRTEMRRTHRSLFGLSLPRLHLFGRDDQEDAEPNQIDAAIASASDASDGQIIVTLEDGSRWRSLEAYRGNPPKRGAAITISRGALGSYFMRLSGMSLRARRIG